MESGLALVTFLRNSSIISMETLKLLIYFLVPSSIIVFSFYLGTIIYFIRMAHHYVNILIEKYNFAKARVMLFLYFIAMWLLLTLLGF